MGTGAIQASIEQGDGSLRPALTMWARCALFWLFLTVVTSVGGLLFDDRAPSLTEFAVIFAAHAGFWLIWSLVAFSAYSAASTVVPVPRDGWRSALTAYAALAAATSIVFVLFYALIGIGSGAGLHPDAAPLDRGGFDHDALWFFTVNAALFAFVSIGAASLKQYRRTQAEDAERKARELEHQRLLAAISEARLTALRAQIHPHFIFNALNSIASLVETRKADLAYEAVTSLADILRLTFQSLDRKAIRLEEEFALVRYMFELGRLRFGDRFSWTLVLPQDLSHEQVQPFLVQPLAENALLHAVGNASGPIHVEVSASRSNGMLELKVADNGPGQGSGVGGGNGVGLKNLRERLSLINGTLTLPPRAVGFVAVIALPAPREQRA